MTPTWAQLHELEPGLRPIGLTAGHDGTWDQEWIGLDGSVDAGVSDRIGGPVGDALSRDRACEWLGENLHPVKVEPVGTFRLDGKIAWAVRYSGVETKDGANVLVHHNDQYHTRDEALRAACAAVIWARREPPPSASSPGTAPPATP